MPATKQNQVVEPRGAANGPVAHVVSIAMASGAAWKSTPRVSCRERAADRWRDGPGLPADVQHRAVGSVLHHDEGGVAGQPLRRFAGNVRPVIERGLACRSAGIDYGLQGFRFNMQHDLVPITCRPAIQIRRQCALGHQPQRISAALRRWHLLGDCGRRRRAFGITKQPVCTASIARITTAPTSSVRRLQMTTIPVRQLSQCAQERKPLFHPAEASNSRMRTSSS